jgi:hypothetical protein
MSAVAAPAFGAHGSWLISSGVRVEWLTSANWHGFGRARLRLDREGSRAGLQSRPKPFGSFAAASASTPAAHRASCRLAPRRGFRVARRATPDDRHVTVCNGSGNAPRFLTPWRRAGVAERHEIERPAGLRRARGRLRPCDRGGPAAAAGFRAAARGAAPLSAVLLASGPPAAAASRICPRRRSAPRRGPGATEHAKEGGPWPCCGMQTPCLPGSRGVPWPCLLGGGSRVRLPASPAPPACLSLGGVGRPRPGRGDRPLADRVERPRPGTQQGPPGWPNDRPTRPACRPAAACGLARRVRAIVQPQGGGGAGNARLCLRALPRFRRALQRRKRQGGGVSPPPRGPRPECGRRAAAGAAGVCAWAYAPHGGGRGAAGAAKACPQFCLCAPPLAARSRGTVVASHARAGSASCAATLDGGVKGAERGGRRTVPRMASLATEPGTRRTISTFLRL